MTTQTRIDSPLIQRIATELEARHTPAPDTYTARLAVIDSIYGESVRNFKQSGHTHVARATNLRNLSRLAGGHGVLHL